MHTTHATRARQRRRKHARRTGARGDEAPRVRRSIARVASRPRVGNFKRLAHHARRVRCGAAHAATQRCCEVAIVVVIVACVGVVAHRSSNVLGARASLRDKCQCMNQNGHVERRRTFRASGALARARASSLSFRTRAISLCSRRAACRVRMCMRGREARNDASAAFAAREPAGFQSTRILYAVCVRVHLCIYISLLRGRCRRRMSRATRAPDACGK